MPDPNNRVHIKDSNIYLDYKDNNVEAYDRLVKKLGQVLRSIDHADHLIPSEFFFKKKIPLESVCHQVGTCRFGENPKTSVLDVNCKAHELDNLYVVDGSFFVSSAAVNPGLTIMANALRVGEHILDRLP